MMNVLEVKRLAQDWVEHNAPAWSGLRAAHFVGGVTGLPDSAAFPSYKDLDMHLIFEDDSPTPESQSHFMNILEVSHHGLIIEAGVKRVSDYASAESVLANPEIAYHLAADSVIYDPSGLLAGLHECVKREYPRRKWVLARIEHERRGLNAVLDMLPMARASMGAGATAGLLGYAMTFIGALFSVVTLQSPTTGSRLYLRLRDVLTAYERPDLYEEVMAIMGWDKIDRTSAEARLQAGAEAFDLAVQVRRTPNPFEHKLLPHQRPYFVESCRSLIAEGHYREAMAYITAFYHSACRVILSDGPEEAKPIYAARLAQALREMGMETEAQCDATLARARRWHDDCFALARHIADVHPGIVD